MESLDRIIESERLEEGVKKRHFKSLAKYVQAICLATTRYFEDKKAEPGDKVLLEELHSYYDGEIGSYSDFGRVKAKVKERTVEKYNPTLKKLGLSLGGEDENWVVTLLSDLGEVTPVIDLSVIGENGESGENEEDQKKLTHGSHGSHHSRKGNDQDPIPVKSLVSEVGPSFYGRELLDLCKEKGYKEETSQEVLDKALKEGWVKPSPEEKTSLTW